MTLKSGMAAILVTLGLSAALLPAPLAAAEFKLPKGPNRALVYAKCRTCHDLQYVEESKGMSPGAWDGLLDDMEGFGVELTAGERKKILTYLATYLSSNPPPAPVASVETAVDAVDGKIVFASNCTACHQQNAKGIGGVFPPLANNPDLFLARKFPLKVLLNGMTGAITVNGAPFEGEMPSFSHLPDAEIAAVVNYLRGSFGNGANMPADMAPVTAQDVAALRKTPLTPAQVLAYRAGLK